VNEFQYREWKESMEGMLSTPLKWTSRGNYPLERLRYEQHWEDSPEMTIHKEFWYFEDGEIAANNVAAYGRKPLVIGAEQAKM
jgi:hypothetical protein